jgi:hypothetical protein
MALFYEVVSHVPLEPSDEMIPNDYFSLGFSMCSLENLLLLLVIDI